MISSSHLTILPSVTLPLASVHEFEVFSSGTYATNLMKMWPAVLSFCITNSLKRLVLFRLRMVR